MEIHVGRKDFEKAMALAALSLGPASSDDYTRWVLVRVSESGKPGRIDLLTSTGKTGTRIPVLVETNLPAGTMFVVEGWRLKQWVSASSENILTFTINGNAPIKAATSRGSVMLPIFDPTQFRNWEAMVSPTPVASSKINAEKLHAILTCAKNFVGDPNPTTPGISVIEVSQGTLRATDLKALVVIEAEEIAARKLRIHGKDVAAFLSFLAAIDGDVEIQDHAMFLLAEASSGEVFVVVRPSADYEFPTINNLPRFNEDPYWVEVDPSELKSGITSLVAGAEREDYLVNFKLRRSEDLAQEIELVVGMKPVVSTQGVLNEVRVGCFASGKLPGAVEFPKSGVDVDYRYINKMFSGRKDKVRLGFHVVVSDSSRKNGWIQMSEDREGYHIFTSVKWARSVEDVV
jgi:hypothetical protein